MSKKTYCAEDKCEFEVYEVSEIDETVRGINDSLEKKQGSLNFDLTPTSGSANPVTSDGLFNALSNKLNKNAISSGTANPSGGNNGDIYFKYQ